jgi:nascent polypeptide-associated complex subunit alpha
MMPGMRGVNPRQMKQAMKRMGISTEDLDGVEEIVIRTKDKEYVFKEASVSIMNVQGQKTFQIVGEPEVRAITGPSSRQDKAAISTPSVPEEDVQLVMDQTGCSREKALQALKDTDGQPAEAIIKIISS